MRRQDGEAGGDRLNGAPVGPDRIGGGAGQTARPAVITLLGKQNSAAVVIADRLSLRLRTLGQRVIILRPSPGMELDVEDEAGRFAAFDVIIVLGIQARPVNPIEVFRLAAGHETTLLPPDEALALVTDADLPHQHRFGPEDTDELAEFVMARLTALRDY